MKTWKKFRGIDDRQLMGALQYHNGALEGLARELTKLMRRERYWLTWMVVASAAIIYILEKVVVR